MEQTLRDHFMGLVKAKLGDIVMGRVELADFGPIRG